MEGILTNNKLYLILLFSPLLAAVVQVFFGRKLPRKGDFISILAVGISLFISLVLFVAVLKNNDPYFLPRGVASGPHIFNVEWLKVGSTIAHFSLYIDNLTIFMLVVVCIVSFFVHLYSVGYMHDDKRYTRFYAYLSLFTFSMLGLVLSGSLVFLFIFWELVGLSSYLLIGFWFEKESAANACKKAFLTTKLADLGFLLGILYFYIKGKSFLYTDLIDKAIRNALGAEVLTLGSILLFLGAMGKSAQFPFHIWLPDAMEGPTPVSALIHAATMVAAGVFMVCRLFPLFTDTSLLFVAYIGGFTTCFASTMALVATDFKRVLAYSTVSQLGFMMLGLGVGALQAGFFHLWTHAYFKALLFLAAGCVIHAVGTGNIFEMGGLKKYMPITFVTMLIGTLAICGIPPYLVSGFYSKDAIVAGVLEFIHTNRSHILLGVLAFLSIFLTAFYMTRLVVVVFFGQPHKEGGHGDTTHTHLHEAPITMTIPLIVLAFLSVVSGWGGFIEKLIPGGKLYEMETAKTGVSATHITAVLGSFAFAITGVLFSLLFYLESVQYFDPAKWAEKFKGIYNLLINRYYIDDKIVNGFLIKYLLKFEDILAKFDLLGIDRLVDNTAEMARSVSNASGKADLKYIDGAVDGVGEGVLTTGQKLRVIQSGNIRQYISWIVGGAFVILIIVVIISKVYY